MCPWGRIWYDRYQTGADLSGDHPPVVCKVVRNAFPDGLPGVLHEKGGIAVGSDRVLVTLFLFVTFIGLVIAWRWEGPGAAMGFAGLIGFNISAPVSLATAAVISATGSFVLPVAIFFSCWWRTKLQIRLKDG